MANTRYCLRPYPRSCFHVLFFVPVCQGIEQAVWSFVRIFFQKVPIVFAYTLVSLRQLLPCSFFFLKCCHSFFLILFYRSVIVCRLKHSLKFASYIIDAYCQLNLAATIYSVFHRVAIVEIGIAPVSIGVRCFTQSRRPPHGKKSQLTP